MPKIFSVDHHSTNDICRYIEQNNLAESVLIFQTDTIESIDFMQRVIAIVRAINALHLKCHTIILKPLSRYATLSTEMLIELALIVNEPRSIDNKLTIKIAKCHVNVTFFKKMAELTQDSYVRSGEVEFTNSERTKAILTIYKDNVALIKAKVEGQSQQQQPEQALQVLSLSDNNHSQKATSAIQEFIKSQLFISHANDSMRKTDHDTVVIKRVITTPYRTILVPQLEAQLLLAEYYQRKHGIQIIILQNWKQQLAPCLKKLLQAPSIKVGIIIWTKDSCEKHIVPLLFESAAGKKYLSDLDSLDYGGDDPFDLDEIIFNVKKLCTYLVANQLNHQIELCATGCARHDSLRQIDQHSCFIDAMSVLKEALLDDEGMQVKIRGIQSQNNYYFFKFPGAWAVSVQNKSYITFHGIDENVMLRKRLNNHTAQESLQQFLIRHTKAVTIVNQSSGYQANKKINCYSQQKSHKFLKYVVEMYERFTDAELKKIYSSRQGEIVDQLVLSSQTHSSIEQKRPG